MEADGVPFGYDRWHKIGIVRQPIDRLWSLYKFCQSRFGKRTDYPVYQERISRSTSMYFNDWIVNNEVVFTDPFSSENGSDYYPQYAVRHALPETRKSQFIYLRPDLGTKVRRYEELNIVAEELGVSLEHERESDPEPTPPLSEDALRHVVKFFAWDTAMTIGNLKTIKGSTT
jgi:hypothetical protein